MFPYLTLKSIRLGLLCAFLGNCFIFPAGAEELALPAPGAMVHVGPSFHPPVLKGLKIHPDDPFRIDFIVAKGDSGTVPEKSQVQELVKYFMTSMTVPEQDLWVNLSPYEKDRIIAGRFGETGMGRELLAQDYLLKQVTASLIYPEEGLGRQFWNKVYAEAAKRYGRTSVPVNTFNKVWIVPEKAVVYENAKAGTAYVVESTLRVMLEQDYLALNKNQSHPVSPSENRMASHIIRELVIPQLTKDVNSGRNFAGLRQIYNSLILAVWYKRKIKESVLAAFYADKNKIGGLSSAQQGNSPEAVYQQYLEAFKKGVYNYIKEEQDPATGQSIPRKYFSGGVDWTELKLDQAMTTVHALAMPNETDLVEAPTSMEVLPAGSLKERWKWFTRPAANDNVNGKTVVLKEEEQFVMGELVDVRFGNWQQGTYFPGQVGKAKRQPHKMGHGVTNIRCTAIEYDSEGNVVGFMFEGIHPKEGSVRAHWQLKDGTWQGEKQDNAAAWRRFSQPNPERKGMTVEFRKDEQFVMADLVYEARGKWQEGTLLPGESNGSANRPHTMGRGVTDIRCTSITYDLEGHAVGLIFEGQHPKTGWVSAYWELKDGIWQGEKQDKAAAWRRYTQPNLDRKGMTVVLKSNEQFILESLVSVPTGLFQRSLRFPGEIRSLGVRPHKMGMGVTDIRTKALTYDWEGNVVGVTFEGSHPQEGNVGSSWELVDGVWQGKKLNTAEMWKVFTGPNPDRRGMTVELKKDDQFVLGNLIHTARGLLQEALLLPGEEKNSKARPHKMGRGVTGIRCTALKYNMQGQVVGVMFEGNHPKEGRVRAYWERRDGRWVGGKQGLINDFDAVIDAILQGDLSDEEIQRCVMGLKVRGVRLFRAGQESSVRYVKDLVGTLRHFRNVSQYRLGAAAKGNLWYEGSEEDFDARRRLIFGEGIDDWLNKIPKKGNAEDMGRAIARIAREWASISEAQGNPALDMRVAFIAYAVANDLNLGTSAFRDFTSGLKKALTPEQAAQFSIANTTLRNFVDLMTALARPEIQGFLERQEFLPFSRRERPAALREKLTEALGGRFSPSNVFFDILPKQLSVHIDKEAFLGLYEAAKSGTELKMTRDRKGLLWEDVAEGTGIPVETIKKIEAYPRSGFMEEKETIKDFYDQTETLIQDPERMDALREVIYDFYRGKMDPIALRDKSLLKYIGLTRQQKLASEMGMTIGELNEQIDQKLRHKKDVVRQWLTAKLEGSPSEPAPVLKSNEAQQVYVIADALNDDDQMTLGAASEKWLAGFLGSPDVNVFRRHVRRGGPPAMAVANVRPKASPTRVNEEEPAAPIRLRFVKFEGKQVEQDSLLEKVASDDPEAADTSDTLADMVNAYMPLAQSIIDQMNISRSAEGNDRHKILISLSFIALHDIIQRYAREASGGNLEAYIRAQLPVQLRKSEYGLKNEQLSWYSADTLVGDDSGTTVKDLLPDPNAVTEEDLIKQLDRKGREDLQVYVNGETQAERSIVLAANPLDALIAWFRKRGLLGRYAPMVGAAYKNGKIAVFVGEGKRKPVPFARLRDYPLASGEPVYIIVHLDEAQVSTQNGGIDLTPSQMNLTLKNEGAGIQLHVDPAKLLHLQNASGLTPVVLHVQPMTNLRRFLGLSEDAPGASIGPNHLPPL